jgi:hypothetical protein
MTGYNSEDSGAENATVTSPFSYHREQCFGTLPFLIYKIISVYICLPATVFLCRKK